MASRARSSSPFAFSHNGKLREFNREASYSYGHSSSGSKSSRRSVTPGRTRSLSIGTNMKAHIGYPSPPQSYASSNSLSTGSFMLDYPSSANRTKENITVTVRFRPLSAREIQKGDEVSWCMQGDTTVRSVFNEGTAYAYGIISLPDNRINQSYA